MTDIEKSEIVHGVWFPETYSPQTRSYLTRVLSAYTGGHGNGFSPRPHTLVPLSHLEFAATGGTMLDTVIIPLDVAREARNGQRDIFERISEIKTQNPGMKTVVWYANRPEIKDNSVVDAAFCAPALSNPDIDLVYTDVPMQMAFNAKSSALTRRAFGTHPVVEFRKILQTMVDNLFEGRVRSPQLLDTYGNDIDQIGKMQINRTDRNITIAGRTISLKGDGVDILGILAAHQGSWVPNTLMMTRLYTHGELQEGRNPRSIDFSVKKLNKKFNTIGIGAVHNIHGVGNFVRPDDFKKPAPAPL